MFNQKGLEVLQKMAELQNLKLPKCFINIDQYLEETINLNDIVESNDYEYIQIITNFKLKKIVLSFDCYKNNDIDYEPEYDISISIFDNGFNLNIYMYPDYEIKYIDNKFEIIRTFDNGQIISYEELIDDLEKEKYSSKIIELLKFIFDK